MICHHRVRKTCTSTIYLTYSRRHSQLRWNGKDYDITLFEEPQCSKYRTNINFDDTARIHVKLPQRG